MLQPVTIFCAAAPEDRSLLAQWETHLLPLQQAGYISVWSEHHLQAGETRNEQIRRYFEQADLILLLLSSDFFVSEECNELMKQALQRSQQGLVRVIPVLLRFAAWQDTDLGMLSSLPANGRPITRWEDRDEAFQSCIDALKHFIHLPAKAMLAPDQGQKQKILPKPQSSPTVPHYHSCFISYTHQDKPFAERLYIDLQAQGVSCWFAPHNMKIGDRIRPTIDQAIKRQDKLLLLLSVHALQSVWIEDEVEAAFEYEKLEKREMLFPIQLDNSVKYTTQVWAMKLRRTRYIGDFTEQSTYQKAFEQLLRALTVDEREQ